MNHMVKPDERTRPVSPVLGHWRATQNHFLRMAIVKGKMDNNKRRIGRREIGTSFFPGGNGK